jgi:hypothetical protein
VSTDRQPNEGPDKDSAGKPIEPAKDFEALEQMEKEALAELARADVELAADDAAVPPQLEALAIEAASQAEAANAAALREHEAALGDRVEAELAAEAAQAEGRREYEAAVGDRVEAELAAEAATEIELANVEAAPELEAAIDMEAVPEPLDEDDLDP